MLKPSKTCRGFTIVELMITVTIAGILLAVAVPSFKNMMVSNRLTTQANDFVAAINFARSEAIRRNGSVTFCQSDNGSVCVASTGGIWKNWIVRTAAGAVVRQGNINLYGGKIKVNSTFTSDQTIFTSDGLAQLGATSRQITVCATNLSSNNLRRMTIGSASRISVATETIGTCP